MKKSVTLFVLFVGLWSYSQTFEQTAAEKSCECIKKLTNLTDESYRNCISTSMSESLMIGNSKENLEKIGTVDGIKSTLVKIDAIVQSICKVDRSAELEEKQNLFYSYSKNTAATNFYKTGKDFMEKENFKAAIENFEKAVQNDKNFVLALDDMAASHRRLENFDEAIAYYKKSLAIYPEGDFALMNMGVIYSLKKDYNTSIEFYNKLVRFYPENAEGYYGLSRNFAFLGENENALINIIKAHKIYKQENSEYVKDSQQMLEVIFQIMKEDGKEEDFRKIAKENDVEIK